MYSPLGTLGQKFTPTPEMLAAGSAPKFDAPASAGPWALNKSGQWFKVTKRAPNSKVVGNIYVPPGHPSVRKTIPELNKTIPGEKRFLDPKFRAANQATLRGAWRDLFFKIAPRGSGPEGIGAGRAFDGTDEDYDSEGGDLFPGLQPSDPQAAELVAWWGGQNGFDPTYGSGKLDLSWLRVYTDSNGYQRYKQFGRGEVAAYMNRWMIAKNDFVCGGDDVINLANQTMSEQSRRAAAQTAKDYSPHWAWHITPISQCMPRSSERRRKAIKKAAVVAAVVVGAVYLGPMIAGAVKGGGVAGATAGKVGAKVGISKLAAASGAKALTVASVTAGASAVLPKVVQSVNAARTIKAISDGEVPPPPITLEGSNFTDYAQSVGGQLLEEQLKRKLTEKEEAILREEVRQTQINAQRQLPYGGAPMYPMPTVAAPVQAAMAKEKDTNQMLQTALIIGAPILLMLVMRS